MICSNDKLLLGFETKDISDFETLSISDAHTIIVDVINVA